VRDAMAHEFSRHGLASDQWISSVQPLGAHVLD
jgi:hypothetical protein